VKKKVPVVTVAEAEEAGRLSGLPLEATVALADVASAIKDGLLGLCADAGLMVLAQMLDAEMTARVGPKHAKLAGREANGHGTTTGAVVLGGRTLSVKRPRGRSREGAEIELDTWKALSAKDLLDQLTVERMLAGVATRRHGDIEAPISAEIDARSKATGRSSISRRWKRATEAALGQLMARDLAGLDVAVIMIDGLFIAGQCCVVALVITTDGTKIPVGLWLGDTENKTVVTSLLADLAARGLHATGGLLVVIDGAKALAAAVAKVFGGQALVQRCTLHKRRNVADHLPDELAKTIDWRLTRAFNHADPAKGLDAARAIAGELRADHPDAAASLLEGLTDMFTVRRLGISGRLALTLTNTNCIESMISVAQRTMGRVTRGPVGSMKKRWAAGMLEAERSFRRVKGCKEMPTLVAAVRAEVARRASDDETVTPHNYNQAAA
jgi:putative transposase